MLTSIDVKFIFNCLFIGKFRRKRYVQFRKYSPNSRCRPPSCIINVLAMFFVNSSLILSSRNEWNVRPFCTHYQNQPNLVPRSSRLTVQYSGNYAVKLTSFFKHRILLPNLVNCSWWWWIIRVIVANQIRRNVLNKNALKSLDCWEIR